MVKIYGDGQLPLFGVEQSKKWKWLLVLANWLVAYNWWSVEGNTIAVALVLIVGAIIIKIL